MLKNIPNVSSVILHDKSILIEIIELLVCFFSNTFLFFTTGTRKCKIDKSKKSYKKQI